MGERADDIQSITDAINRYSFAIDFREWGRMDDVFHPDGVITMDDWRFTARDGVAWIRACIERYSITHHSNSNIMIEFDDQDRASAVSYVRAWHRGGPEDDVILEVVGHYFDKVVRTPAGWRIALRDERVTVIGGDFALFDGLEEVRDRLLAASAAA